MNCWSCEKEIPNDATFCSYCEAKSVAGPSAEEQMAAASALATMSPELINELRNAFKNSSTGEEFVNQIMVGDCPRCGSSNTGNCEDDPEINDPCIGRCFACGQLWCPDCGKCFEDAQRTWHECPIWEGIEADDWDRTD